MSKMKEAKIQAGEDALNKTRSHLINIAHEAMSLLADIDDFFHDECEDETDPKWSYMARQIEYDRDSLDLTKNYCEEVTAKSQAKANTEAEHE